jgi:hypothetical protein
MDPVDNAVQKELNANDGVKSKRKPKKPAKKKTKPKAKKATKRKATKPKSKAKRPTKAKAGANVARPERLDMRLTKAEKAKVSAKAKKTRRTITSLIIEAIEKIR